MKRLIAIGDIHGHLSKLNVLLETVKPTPDDQLVFLGDYIDRGPDSCKVVELLMALRHDLPQTIFLRGNHEQMLLDALIECGSIEGQRLRDLSPTYAAAAGPSDLRIFQLNGGAATLRSYGVADLDWGLPEAHVTFLREATLWWRHDLFVFVHAGIEADIPLEQQDPEYVLWQRYALPGQNGDIHVVGHHPTTNRRPLFELGRYSLDTGAGYGHALTACDVLTRKVWQAD